MCMVLSEIDIYLDKFDVKPATTHPYLPLLNMCECKYNDF